MVLFNTKIKINNFNVNMSFSYININININIYYQEFILELHSPFKFCLFFLKIHGNLPPFSNGYVCEGISTEDKLAELRESHGKVHR